MPLATWMVNCHRQLPEKTTEFFGWNEMQTKTGIAVQRAKACCQGQYLFFFCVIVILSVHQIIITFCIHVHINNTTYIRGYFVQLEQEMHMPVSIEVELLRQGG